MAEKDPRKVQFGNRLRELREAAGLSREELASKVGLSAGAIIQWEVGVREPGWLNVVALAAALGVTCEAFAREPADRELPGPGRPRKADAEPPPEPPKRKPGKK